LIVAYHEAGHAVANLFLDLPVKLVTIVPHKNSGGRVEAPGSSSLRRFDAAVELSLRKRDRLERNVRSSLAGAVAERRFARRSWRSWHSQHDWMQASWLIDTFLTGGNARATSAYFKLLQIQTENLIENHWREVEAVAQALVVHRTLVAKELSAVVRASFEARIKEQRARNLARKRP
jgi:hypothetical protein